MNSTLMTAAVQTQRRFIPQIAPGFGRLQLLAETNKSEVLHFLARRPVHTVVMTSLIHDNGIESRLNRGRFYGYRDMQGSLEGVALIGHTTLVEVHSEAAAQALALMARESETPIHLMMSDGQSIRSFWQFYASGIGLPRLLYSERLFEMTYPVEVRLLVPELRLARPDELLAVARVHAEIAFEESGVNPMEKDRDSFLQRVRRRIEQGRIWVVFDSAGKLIFKADVVAETPDVSYLEGIYVHPERRGAGIAADCLSQLGRTLLEKVKYVCLLSNENFRAAHRAYLKAGFQSRDCCVTIFT